MLDLDLPRLAPLVPGGQSTSDRGRIVGHAIWSYYTADNVVRNEEARTHPRMQSSTGPALPSGTNVKLVHLFEDLDFETVAFHIRGKRCFVLNDITVLSTHLRTGVAKRLVERKFPFADRDGLPVIFASSPIGVPLYQACGFEGDWVEKGAIPIDCREWGGIEAHRHVMTIRHPKGRKLGSGQESRSCVFCASRKLQHSRLVDFVPRSIGITFHSD